VGHVVPVVGALAGADGAAEVVDRDGVTAGLGEALGQLDVEAVEAADIGEDEHGRVAAVGRLSERGREARAVGGGQLERLGGGASRRKNEVLGQRRRTRVIVEAHGTSPKASGVACEARSPDRRKVP
jgi:hypothetical protein